MSSFTKITFTFLLFIVRITTAANEGPNSALDYNYTLCGPNSTSCGPISTGDYNPNLRFRVAQVDLALLSYKLSLVWPNGFCNTKFSICKGAEELPDYFTLHRLWPIYRGTCNDSIEEFEKSKIKDLEGRLIKYWPNMKTLKDSEVPHSNIWKHGWEAHGTRCNMYGVETYFSESLDLSDSICDIVKAILGITGEQPLTTVKEVKDAFNGWEPYIYCKYGDDGDGDYDSTYYFYQIEFCLNNNQEYYNCPPKQENNFCKENQPFSY